jgi:hypothetical protein
MAHAAITPMTWADKIAGMGRRAATSYPRNFQKIAHD